MIVFAKVIVVLLVIAVVIKALALVRQTHDRGYTVFDLILYTGFALWGTYEWASMP